MTAERDESVRLTWLGTAGFRLRYRDTQILMDPHLTRPQPGGRAPLTAAQAASSDALLVTHGHFDHAMDTPHLASMGQSRILAPARVCLRLQRFSVPSERLHPNEKTVSVRIGDLAVDVLPSRHIRFDLPLIAMTVLNALRSRAFAEALGLGLSWPLGSNSDFLIRCGPKTVYHAGSLGADPKQRLGLKPDLALLPCAGRSNMVGPLAELIRAMEPARVILHHHDVFWPGFVLPQPAQLVAQRLRGEIPGLNVGVAVFGRTERF